MGGLEDFVTQFYQPYFFYSLVFLLTSFVCVEVFLKFNPYLSARSRSILYLTPLVIPVFVLTFFQPRTLISMLPTGPIISFSANASPGIIIGSARFPSLTVVSITGLLCLIGAVAAATYFVITTVFGQRIALKAFHVVMMSPDEYESVQEKVKEISQRMNVPAPKVGLTDDLRPNAFTIGSGRRAVIVFSLGILKMLDNEELTAVVSHEIAHVKARDYLFRSISYSLNILSFFNPLSYFAASSAQKEREMLADQRGAALLSQPKLMANVLEKLEKALQMFPQDRLADRVTTSLFLVSPIARKPEILAAHPQIAHRVRNITKTTSSPLHKPTKLRVVTLSLILILAASTIGYCMISLQATAETKNSQVVARINGAFEQTTQSILSSGTNLTLPSGAMLAPNSEASTLLPQGNAELIQNARVLIVNSSENTP